MPGAAAARGVALAGLARYLRRCGLTLAPFATQIEKLDFAFRKKSPEKAAAALTAVNSSVAAVKAAVF